MWLHLQGEGSWGGEGLGVSRVDVQNVHLFVQCGIGGSALHLVESIVNAVPLRTPP